MSYLTVFSFFLVVVCVLFIYEIDCGGNYEYPHFIGVHVLSRSRNRREVEDERSLDISTLCCNFTEPMDERSEKFNKIFDTCEDQVDSRPEFNYTIEVDMDYDGYNLTMNEIEGDFNFTAALENIIYNYSSVAPCSEKAKYYACIQECIFQNLEAITPEGDFIPEKVEEYIKWMTPISKDDLWRGFDQCGTVFQDSHRYSCNSAAMDYIDCIIEFSDFHCPLQHRTNAPGCSYDDDKDSQKI